MERNEPKSELKEILSGMRLVLEEIRDLRIDLREHLEDASRDRKQAAGDRKRADERFEAYARRADERFETYERKADQDRRTFNGTLRAILTVARDFRAEQKKQTNILLDIAHAVRLRGNGQRGNGK